MKSKAPSKREKHRKVEYGARTPHALSSVSFAHVIEWRVLRQMPDRCPVVRADFLSLSNEKEVLLKLRSLRTDPNPPEEWISLSVEKEVLNKGVRTGGLPPGYIDQ